MPIIDYPFQAQGPFSELSPILPIIIINPENRWQFQTWGLIDTGASATTIPGFIATEIGHNIERVKPTPGLGAGGAVDVYEHTCSINILSMAQDGKVNKDEIVIKVSRRRIGVINGLHYVLLGVNDFLKKYVVTIDYPRKVFSIQKPQNRKSKQ